MSASPAEGGPISPARKWAITVTVMVVAFMQILDTSVTNVIRKIEFHLLSPHMIT